MEEIDQHAIAMAGLPKLAGGAGKALRLRAPTEEALEAAGAMLGSSTCRGDIIALYGPLGVGKTCLCRAYLRAATGDPDLEVASPTFLLKYTYTAESGMAINHVDLYRLGGDGAPARLELDKAVEEGALLVEWAERLGSDLRAERLDVSLEMEGADGERRLTMVPAAEGRWPTRVSAVQEALAQCDPGQAGGLSPLPSEPSE